MTSRGLAIAMAGTTLPLLILAGFEAHLGDLSCAGALVLAAGLAATIVAILYSALAQNRRAAQLAAAAAVARIGVWRQDIGSPTGEWSPELQRLVGMPKSRPTRAEQLDVLHPDDRAAAQAFGRRVATTLRPEGADLRAMHPTLGVRYLRWEMLPETDAQGRLSALWGYAQDITERHAAENRQRQESRMDALGQMAAGLAHDFNNLLCTVVLNLDMLTQAAGRGAGRGDDNGIAEMAARARAAAERGAELTGQLLAFAGKRPMECQHLDLPRAVRASVSTLAPAPGVALTMSPQDDAAAPMVVEADPAQLHAAVQALLAHAQAGGGARRRPAADRVVRVTLNEIALPRARAAALGLRSGRYAELAVHDDSEAPSPELLPRLLEPFYRPVADGTDPTGTGVHLALAHGVARGHGGALTLEGRPGEGTTARLLLPLVAPQLADDLMARADAAASLPHSAMPGLDDERAPLAGMRVLLVEDDEAVRETTEALLREIGATVTSAEDGATALLLLDSTLSFDLLLSDVVLPGWPSGIDVVEAAATLRPTLPALLASGYAAPAQELGRALPAGVRLLHKPYRRADLLEAIAHATNRARTLAAQAA